MYVLMYICHLLHIYLSRNVASYIDNVFEQCLFCNTCTAKNLSHKSTIIFPNM